MNGGAPRFETARAASLGRPWRGGGRHDMETAQGILLRQEKMF